MPRLLWIACLTFAAACTPAFNSADADPEAVAIAQRAADAVGGVDGLAEIRFLRFDFEVEVDSATVYTARHLWDRETGRYREEWDLFGDEAQALFNVESRDGYAFRAGESVTGEAADEILDQARANHLNDAYWLLMPWKLTDPGVRLTRVGPDSLDGGAYDVVHLEFEDGAGDSPGDEHWVWVHTETGRIGQTGYFLERFEAGPPTFEEATLWAWSDYEVVGPVTFARDRAVVRAIHDPFTTAQSRMTTLAVLDAVDDAVFESLSTAMPGG